MDLPSDYPYANLDDDPFVELGVGRFLAEDVHAAILQASRSVVFEHLVDGPWTKTAATTGMEYPGVELYKSVGFSPLAHHDGPVIDDNRNPVLGAGFIMHVSHSGPRVMGKTFDYKHDLLLAPAFVVSSGCSTHALDNRPKPWSLPAKLMRNGVVAVSGNNRLGIGQQGQYVTVLSDRLMVGEPIGQAYRSALNALIVTAQTTGEMDRGDGGNRYSVYNAQVFGDPALRMRVPQSPDVRAARQDVDPASGSVTVHAPSEWWREEKTYFPEEWGYKGDKMYLWRGLGTGAPRRWERDNRRNHEESCFLASFTTDEKIVRIQQQGDLEKPLGWDGQYFIDQHPDGTRTAYWRVRLIDYNLDTGEVNHEVPSIEYHVETQ